MKLQLSLVVAALAGVEAFLPAAPITTPSKQIVRATTDAISRRPSTFLMSSLFLDENALADRIKDGLLIRYLPEVSSMMMHDDSSLSVFLNLPILS